MAIDHDSAASSTATGAGSGSGADELRPPPSLPLLAFKELLSFGACLQCISRFFGNCKTQCNEIGDSNDGGGNVCRFCWGILQFIYVSGDGALVKHDSAIEFATSICELVKKEGHQAESFSLEVSIPSTVNENDVWVSLKEKFGSEEWFNGKFQTEAVSVKDALKSLIAKPLQKLLLMDLKSGSGTFHVRLTYSSLEEPMNGENKSETKFAKKRKTWKEQGEDSSDNKGALVLERCSGTVQDLDSKLKVSAFRLACHCYRTPVYIGGRYLKLSRNVSQTRWIIDDERMGEASVEEILGNVIFPACQADSYKFHAAGREDIDVRMLGSGRPFLVEIQNARVVPTEELLKEMEMKINSLDKKLIKVKNLKLVDEQGWALMREGEAEKQKQYAALVWISRQFEDQDLQTISSLQDLKLIQRTPVRVLHRRSPLEREKIIHWMKIEKIEGNSQYFLLHLCAQAGTYIKEFVHGDLGRTHPSIGSILGCRAEILQLDVTDVKMDCF